MIRIALIFAAAIALIPPAHAEDRDTGWASPVAGAIGRLIKQALGEKERLVPVQYAARGPVMETGYAETETYATTFYDGRRTRDAREMSEALSRIASAECKDYVLLLYGNSAVLYWRNDLPFQDEARGSSPVTDGLKYQLEDHWRKSEHFYDSDIAAVRDAVRSSKKGGTIRDLGDKTLPDSSAMYDIMKTDAQQTPPNCPTS